ncbi:hypothetical protein RvY_04321 [Ramazzottius varieornatus]|uniref:EGF-like domain-containing protein n=1 Tax=Ramazzottius varieornatus TaxID=947166 RepID=A0A1D1UR92_RAMVA|nr:hypothetical protein RvY_04321 [Ramazzottius varieornatus]
MFGLAQQISNTDKIFPRKFCRTTFIFLSLLWKKICLYADRNAKYTSKFSFVLIGRSLIHRMIQMTLWATVLFYISVSICIHSSTATDKKWSFIGVPCQEREFCGNQGSCTFFPKLQLKACNCLDGFEGERCEFLSISTEAVKGEKDNSLCGANLTIGVILLIISVISLCVLFLVCFLVYQLHRRIHKERKISRCPVSRPLLEEMETRDRENRKVHSTFLKRFLGLDALSAGNSAVATRRNSVVNQRTVVQTTLSTTPSTVEVPQKIPQGATRWAQTIKRTILRTEVSVVDQQPEEA